MSVFAEWWATACSARFFGVIRGGIESNFRRLEIVDRNVAYFVGFSGGPRDGTGA